MEGVIVNFRRGRRTVHHYQMIVKINGYNNKEKSSSLIGKTVVWKSPAGKEIKGRITALHGSKGACRVLFEKGMPGQAIGKKVEIV